ncbi:MAG: cation diffusion facilitator family transporter [Candidatus Bathycorpusculaceae bacterium]
MRIGEKRLRALKISACAIGSVVVVEIVLGFAAGSLAILSDGAHALLDAISMFILLIATKASLKPADEEHMYGHEKIEPLGGFIGGVILFGTAIFLIVRALQKVLQGEIAIVQGLELAGFVAIAYTLCVDILRVGILHKTRWESVTLKAGFYHSLADLGSTLIALFGFGMAALGFPIFDVLASLILSAAICYLSIKLVRASGMELSDAVSKEFAEKLEKKFYQQREFQKLETLGLEKLAPKHSWKPLYKFQIT